MAGARVRVRDRLRGAVYGHLLGDALGVPYEFRPPVAAAEVRWGARGTWNQPPGTWSDDGALMLALLDSILSAGWDVPDQARRALAWYRSSEYAPGPRFDVGNTTQASLRRFASGVPAVLAGGAAESDNGTGSLMRILPVGFMGVLCEVTPYDLVRRAMEASSVTHRHARSRLCCAAYALMVDAALRGERPHLEYALLLTRSYVECEEELREVDLVRSFRGPAAGSGYVVDCLWSAWEAFDSTESFEECVRAAVAYGNDTDTTAAVAGGLAGAWYGFGGLPEAWLAELRGREIVERVLAPGRAEAARRR